MATVSWGKAAQSPAIVWEVRAYTKGAQGDVRLGNAAGADLEPVALA